MLIRTNKIIFITFGNTILPRLPTSLCFNTFCSKNFKFFSDFQPYR